MGNVVTILVLNQPCCDELQCHKTVGAIQIITENYKFLQGARTSVQARVAYFLATLSSQLVRNERGEAVALDFKLSGFPVCLAYWSRAYFATPFDAYRAISLGLKQLNGKAPFLKTARVRSRTFKGERAYAWIESFVDSAAQYHPHKCRRFLPNTYNYHNIYRQYVADMRTIRAVEAEILGLTAFRRIFREDFADVEIGRQQKFSKCAVCVALKELIFQCKNNYAKKELEKLLNGHRRFCV